LAAGPYLPFFVTSSDRGQTWSEKKPLTAPWPNASPYGKITVCKDGTALLSIYQMPSNAMGILRSKDNGKTWGDYSDVPGAHDETQVVELPDARLMAFTRMDGDHEHGLLLNESDDHGYSWVRSRKLLQSQQWPFDATVLASGQLLLSFGSRTGEGSFGAGVLLSKDLGKTWDLEHPVLLGWDSLHKDTGYPSTVQLSDGTIVTMYYAVGTVRSPATEAIVVRYTEAQLLEAMSR
jgi:Neuraminidase (sialidase)